MGFWHKTNKILCVSDSPYFELKQIINIVMVLYVPLLMHVVLYVW